MAWRDAYYFLKQEHDRRDWTLEDGTGSTHEVDRVMMLIREQLAAGRSVRIEGVGTLTVGKVKRRQIITARARHAARSLRSARSS